MNPDNKSKNHHYLPVFYLNGFTNQEGQFAIYDYKTNRIKMDMHTPKSHFFIKERNTIELKGNKTDLVEQFYALIDDNNSSIISYIQSIQNESLSREEMILLLEFITMLFWRLPVNDELYKNEYINNPNFGNMFKFKNVSTGEIVSNDETKSLFQSVEMMQSARIYAATISINTASDSLDSGSWGFTYNTLGLNICSDNPIVFKNSEPKNPLDGDFIFPLTKHRILIRTINKIQIKEVTNEIRMCVDVLMFKQGSIFCCSARKDYLQTISQMAPNFEIESLKKHVFKYFE